MIDHRWIHSLRQLPDDGRQLVANFLGGHVPVLLQYELRDDLNHSLAGGRTQLIHTGDLVDRFLKELGDGSLHLLGVGTRQGGGHKDNGEVDLGEQVNTEPGIRRQPQHDGDGHENPGKNRPADADF